MRSGDKNWSVRAGTPKRLPDVLAGGRRKMQGESSGLCYLLHESHSIKDMGDYVNRTGGGGHTGPPGGPNGLTISYLTLVSVL